MTNDGKIRLINTRAHALYDYILAAFLLLSPVIFDFRHETAQNIVMSVAICVLIVALLSKFELGFFKLLPLSWHYAIDLVLGLVLAISPWLLNFETDVFKPHMVMGLSMITVSLLSDRLLTSEVKLLLKRGRVTSRLKPKIKSNRFDLPGLKLVIDPVYSDPQVSKKKTVLSDKSTINPL